MHTKRSMQKVPFKSVKSCRSEAWRRAGRYYRGFFFFVAAPPGADRNCCFSPHFLFSHWPLSSLLFFGNVSHTVSTLHKTKNISREVFTLTSGLWAFNSSCVRFHISSFTHRSPHNFWSTRCNLHSAFARVMLRRFLQFPFSWLSRLLLL